jgi:hypothetical protein
MTLFGLLFGIALGVGSLAWGYMQVGLPQFARGILFFGALWLLAVWQRWRWFAPIGLIFTAVTAALGLWLLNFAPGWMLAGVIGGLAAWDLTYFRYRQHFVASEEERRLMEGRHLVRLLGVTLLGFLLASLAMLVKLQFSFEWAMLLALIVIIGTVQLVAWFRRRGR